MAAFSGRVDPGNRAPLPELRAIFFEISRVAFGKQNRAEKLQFTAIGKVLDLSEGSEAAMWQPLAAGSIRSYQPGPASRAKSEFLKFSRVASGKQNHHHDKLRGAASYTEKTRQRKTHNSKNTKRHRNKVP